MTIRSARGGLDLIGHHSGPVVVSTSNLYLALSDMDAQVANVLLVGGRTDLGVSRDTALARYERRRTEVSGYLQQTAAYAGRDPAVGQYLRDLLNGLGTYQALAAQALLVQSQSPPTEPGRPPTRALELYRQATDVMHGNLLPSARQLIDRQVAQLEQEYSGARSSTVSGSVWVVIVGLALLVLLVGMQIALARAHHRVLNPAIAVATLATLGVFVTGMSAVTTAEDRLGVAKADAFDYTVTLHRARAVSQDAYADEVRYLLDPDRRAQYESAFFDKSQQLVQTAATSVDGYDLALGASLDTYFAGRDATFFGGVLGVSVRHVAFPGELATGENALRFFQSFQQEDRKLRAMVGRGDLDAAVRSYTGQLLSGSGTAFIPYQAALDELIAINQRGFTAAVTSGGQALAPWTWPPPLLAFAVVVLVLVGVAPRLAEYRR
jgi:hypothetical protein